MANRYFGLLAGIFTLSAAGTLFAADLDAPAAPFYSRESIRKTPELFQETKKFGEKSFEQYGFRCGDLMYSALPKAHGINRNPSWELSRFGTIPLLRLASVAMGGVRIGKQWIPLKRHPGQETTVFDREGKRFITTLPCTLEKTKDSAIVLTQSLTPEGIIRIEVEIRLPRNISQQKARLFLQTLSYKEFANSSIRIGEKIFKVPDLSGNERKEVLPLDAVEGEIVLFSNQRNREITIRPAGRVRLSVSALHQGEVAGSSGKYGYTFCFSFPEGGNRLTLFLDIGKTNPEFQNRQDTFAGIDFWSNDRKHIPDYTFSRNLLQNPSFEAGLDFYRDYGWGRYYGENPPLYSVDETESHSGKRSLRTRLRRQQSGATRIATFITPAVPGKEYTFSFYARSGVPGTVLRLTCVGCRWGVFPKTPSFPLSGKWERYEYTVTAPDNGLVFCFHADNSRADGSAWLDDLQLEMSPKATPFDSTPVALKLLTKQKERFYIGAGEAIAPELRISGRLPGRYLLKSRITDLYYRSQELPEMEFTLPASGETTVKLPFASSDLPFGPSELEALLTLPDGRVHRSYHRMLKLEVAPKTPFRKFFSILGGVSSTPAADAALYAALGYGSTNYMEDMERYKLLLANGITDTGSGILKYGPARLDPVAKDLSRRLRFTGEPFSEKLENEIEELSFRVAKANPLIRTWFLQAESRGKFRFLMDKDYDSFVKLSLACRRGILRADPSLGWMVEGGMPNMSPLGDVEITSRILRSLKKLAPDVQPSAIAIHPYRKRPEDPDLDSDAAVFLKMVRDCGYGKVPVLWNEGIYHSPYHVAEWKLNTHHACTTDHFRQGTPSYSIGWGERIAAAYTMRSYVMAMKYRDRIRSYNGWLSWKDLFVDWRSITAIGMIPNTLCRLMDGMNYRDDLRLSRNIRAYLFEDEKGVPAAVFWSHDPAVDRGEKPSPEVEIDFKGNPVEFFDMMGNRLHFQSSGNPSVLPVAPFPVIVKGKAGSYALLKESFAAGRVRGDASFPLEVLFRLKDPANGMITFANRISRPFHGHVLVNGRRAALDIAPGASTPLHFPLENVLTEKNGKINGSLTVYETSRREPFVQKISMDVLLIPNVSGKGLEKQAWIPLNNRSIWHAGAGKSRLEASYRAGWDECHFRLQVLVKDSTRSLPSEKSMKFDYRYDGIQFYMDTFGDNATRSSSVPFDYNDYACSLSLGKDGKVRFYRECAPEQQLAGGIEAPLPGVEVTGTGTTVTPVEGGMLYSVVLPQSMLLPLELKENAFFRFGLIVNDSDGKNRVQTLTNLPGSGGTPYSDPHRWRECLLSR